MAGNVLFSFAGLLMCGVLGCAQQPPTPSDAPDTDFFKPQASREVQDALRERATAFYECFLTSKFRQSEQYVAPDSRDEYYNIQKKPYHSYKIQRMEFSDNFAQAKLFVVVNTDFTFQGHTMQVNVPMVTRWKLEDGLWYWYMVPQTGKTWDSPFGKNFGNTPGSEPGRTPEKPAPLNQTQVAKAIQAIPILTKPVLELGPDNKYQDQTALANRSQKPMKFRVESDPVPGLTIEPGSGEVRAGDAQTFHAVYKGNSAGIRIEETHHMYIEIEQGAKLEMYVKLEPPAAVLKK